MNKDPEMVLSVNSLTVDLGGSRLLEEVSLFLQKGEVVGLIGPNGSGKTTLINTIAGLIVPISGCIYIMGNLLNELRLSERARLISVVPQHIPYTFGFSCFEIVLMGRYPYMKRFQTETDIDRDIVLQSMAVMKITSLVDETVDKLSAGERQRVFIARGLTQQPDLLLLDEPTANLDIQFQIEVMTLIRDLSSNGQTTMAAVHNLPLAARFCDRIVLLDNGRVIQCGTPDEVLTADNIRNVFNVNSYVAHDLLTGELEMHGINLIRPTGPKSHVVRVHVVGGGGQTGEVLYTLKNAGFEVTAGILNNDTNDHRAACILGLDFASTLHPGAIDEKIRVKNGRLISDADWIVVCNGIFADINLVNLRAIEACTNVLLVEESGGLPIDYTGGKALKVYQELRKTASIISLQVLLSELRSKTMNYRLS